MGMEMTSDVAVSTAHAAIMWAGQAATKRNGGLGHEDARWAWLGPWGRFMIVMRAGGIAAHSTLLHSCGPPGDGQLVLGVMVGKFGTVYIWKWDESNQTTVRLWHGCMHCQIAHEKCGQALRLAQVPC